jgi:prepilin-type processing-associated H-X9-DG protein
VSLVLNRDIDPLPVLQVRPFGYPQRGGAARQEPLMLTEIEKYGSRSQVWALADADRGNSPPRDNPWFAQLPLRAVHGNCRNWLFFDWHVATVRFR